MFIAEFTSELFESLQRSIVEDAQEVCPTICHFFLFTVVGLMALKRSVVAVPLMVPLIVVTFLFNAYIRREHFRVAEFLPSRECMKADLFISESSNSSLARNAYLQKEMRFKEKYPENLTEERAADLGLAFRIDQIDDYALLADDSLSYFSCENDPSN